MIEFVSYDGEYPCLCKGTLTIDVDGKIYNLDDVLISGGSCNWHTDEIVKGAWFVSNLQLPRELRPLVSEIERVVNENVPFGCCGGCM